MVIRTNIIFAFDFFFFLRLKENAKFLISQFSYTVYPTANESQYLENLIKNRYESPHYCQIVSPGPT